MSDESHIPVLFSDVMSLLRPGPHGRYIDGTVGAGGHTAGLLERSAPDGRVLAFDRDPEALAHTRQRLRHFGERLLLVHASYAEMAQIAPAHGFSAVDGILLDLGLSSRQLEQDARGFSFLREGPLDMRFDPTAGETAADLVNNLSESELANIFWEYGEERQSRRIARAIVGKRPFTTTTQLAEVVAEAKRPSRRRIHPATQVFQALRIAVNRELDAVETGVKAAVPLLKEGGRLAVISFHSLEDRFVKHYFRRLSKDCICPPRQPICTCDKQAQVRVITRKVVMASEAEIEANPRSRSARLRVVEKIDPT
jgi:16S rRNA (cytosine1402-N4)-methyltransferase